LLKSSMYLRHRVWSWRCPNRDSVVFYGTTMQRRFFNDQWYKIRKDIKCTNKLLKFLTYWSPYLQAVDNKLVI